MAQSSYVDPSKAFLGPFQNPSRILLGLVLPKTKYHLFCFSNKGKYIISFCLFYFYFLKTNGISFVLVINQKYLLVFICFVFNCSKINGICFVLVIKQIKTNGISFY